MGKEIHNFQRSSGAQAALVQVVALWRLLRAYVVCEVTLPNLRYNLFPR